MEGKVKRKPTYKQKKGTDSGRFPLIQFTMQGVRLYRSPAAPGVG